MDVHEGLGGDDQAVWEPQGFEAGSATGTAGVSGYDGSGGAGADTEDGAGAGPDPADGAGAGPDPADGAAGGGTMTVEVGGETRQLPAERDYTGDGRPDAATETGDGRVIVFADTEDNTTGAAGPDGRADEAYVVDKQTGKVVGAAHVDPRTGEWVEGMDTEGPTAAGSGGAGQGSGGAGQGSGGGTAEPAGAGPAGGGGAPEVVTVEAGGHQIGVAVTLDTDGDGKADSGVVYADGRAVVLTSTDEDPEAEQAAIVDPKTGQVVEVVHVNPETGEWEEGPAPAATGGAGAEGTGGTGAGSTGEAGSSGAGGAMTVEVGGETRQLPAERDYTGDGRPDAATETGDGRVIVFADTEDNTTGAAGPDGRADEAYVVDKQTGKVVGAAHVDPRTGEWVEGVDTDGAPAVPSSGGVDS